MEVIIIPVLLSIIAWLLLKNNYSSKVKNYQPPSQTNTANTVVEHDYLKSIEEEIKRKAIERQIELRRQEEKKKNEAQQRLAEQQRQVNLERQAKFKANWEVYQNVLIQNQITKLYHFTDSKNLDSIRSNGGLFSWEYCINNNISIPKPGGSSTSWMLDKRKGLQNYVRVSFVKDHPMLFVAQSDGRINNPVILEINPEVIFLNTTKYATKNAAKNGVCADGSFEIFNSIHFNLFKRRYFDLIEEERQYYQAEVLVLERIPSAFITNIDKF